MSSFAKVSVAVLAASLCSMAQSRFEPGEVRASSSAYVPRSQYLVKTQVQLVEVGVVVRDRDGKAVDGLTKTDFEITEEKKKQNITAFSVQKVTQVASGPVGAKAPEAVVNRRYIGIVFDDLNTTFREFRPAQVAAVRFVKEGLSPGDQVAIFSTYGQQILPFTSDVPKLVAAIEAMRFRARILDNQSCLQLTPYDAYLIANALDPVLLDLKVDELRCERNASIGQTRPLLRQRVIREANVKWDQVSDTSRRTLDALRWVVDQMALMNGTRMMLLASGGFLSGTLEWEQDTIVRRALHSNVVINSLDAKGLYTLDPEVPRGADPQSIIHAQSTAGLAMLALNDALSYVSYGTGGKLFENSNDIDLGFRELGAQPEVSYLLAFSPDSPADDKFHNLSVRVTRDGRYSVQARKGYFAAKEKPPPERKIDGEVLSKRTALDLPANITARPGKLPDGKSVVRVVFQFDVSQTRFLEQFGFQTQKVTFVAALLDANDTFVAGEEAVMEFRLKEETFTRLAREGFAASVDVEAPPGNYRLRVVMEEANKGGITAANQSVEVR